MKKLLAALLLVAGLVPAGAQYITPSGGGGGGGTGTVTSLSAGAGITLTPDPITTTGSIGLTIPVIVSSGGTGLIAGTSGGILGFTAAGTLASSNLLTGSAIVLGGGAGATPTPLGSLGTTTTVLHGNAAGAPTFGAVSLTADVSGVLPVANGGSNCAVASITCFNNITGFTAAGTTGTTSTNLVFSTSPTLVTPVLGVASATSVTASGLLQAGSTIGISTDTLLSRFAAASWHLGAADAASPIAQTLGVQGVVTGTSNTAGANLTIAGSQGTGTGAGGQIIFNTAAAGSTGSTPNALALAMMIDTDGSVYATNAFRSGGVTSTTFTTSLGSAIRLGAASVLAWSSTAAAPGSGNADLIFARDAPDTSAQRRGTTAQTHRLYGSFTDVSNGDWIEFNKAAGGVAYIRTVKNGTGTASTLSLGVAGTNYLTINTSGAAVFSGAIASGGSVPTLVLAGGTCAGTVIAGGSTAGTVTLTGACIATNTLTLSNMPTAPVGYACDAADRTLGSVALSQTSTTTTGTVFTFSATTGATDVIAYKCMAY